MVERVLFGPGGATAANQEVMLDAIAALLTEVQQKYEGGAIDLSPATLAALESITATVSNWPDDYPDAAVLAKLEQVRSLLTAPLTVTGTQDDALTNAQLRASAVPVSGPLTNTQLRQTPVPVAGTFADENGVPFSQANPLPVDMAGAINIENLSLQYESYISTANSTDVPLQANEQFLGPWEDVRDYAAIIMSIYTDASSAQNGAMVEFSADGVDVIGYQFTTIPGGIPGFFSVPPQARYVRINYTNGPVAQTVLEAQVKFSFNPPANPQGPIGGQTTDFSIALGTKAAITSRVMSGPMEGVWLPLGNDGTGRLLVSGTGLTDAELRASPVPVEGTVEVTGTQTDALTDTELRAAPVPVTGTVAVTGTQDDALTDQELRASPVPVGGVVALDAPTLAALEQITVAIQSGQVVGLDSATLTALEQITVSGTVALDAGTLEALETISAVVSGTVALDGPTLAALESISAVVSGTVDVGNFPATQAVTGPLTDEQLRAAAIGTTDATDTEYTHVPATVTDAGNTTLYTPAAGKRVRLRWISAINDPFATSGVQIKVLLGAEEKYRGWLVSKRQVVTGPVDGALIVNLSAPATVLVTALVEEV